MAAAYASEQPLIFGHQLAIMELTKETKSAHVKLLSAMPLSGMIPGECYAGQG